MKLSVLQFHFEFVIALKFLIFATIKHVKIGVESSGNRKFWVASYTLEKIPKIKIRSPVDGVPEAEAELPRKEIRSVGAGGPA